MRIDNFVYHVLINRQKINKKYPSNPFLREQKQLLGIPQAALEVLAGNPLAGCSSPDFEKKVFYDRLAGETFTMKILKEGMNPP